MAALTTRRRVLLGGLVLMTMGSTRAETIGGTRAEAPALPIPPGKRLAFDVVRNSSKIGAHTLDFDVRGEKLTVRIAVDIVIGIGPLTLFRYRHRAVETWRASEVQSIDARTDHDGTKHHLVMARRANGIWVIGDKGSYLAPANTLPATHWNRRMLDGPMVNTETGALMHPHICDHGLETIKTSSGASIQAEHFSLSGDVTLETWYDRSPRWVGLSFFGADGSRVRYLLAGS